MSASRTLLNKQYGGRQYGPTALQRKIAPVARALRMAHPYGTPTPSRQFRALIAHFSDHA